MSPTWADLASLGAPAAVAAVLLMASLWVLHLRLANLGWADWGWTAVITLSASWYARAGGGWPPRRALAAFLAVVWGVRLAGHLGRRLLRERTEDARYRGIRESWRGRYRLTSAGFFALQGFLALVLSAPFFFICRNPREGFSVVEWTGAAVWAAALWGESASDAALERFRSDPANRGRVCREGWWAYSRHPNYFFEWMTWVGLALLASAAPGGWTAVISPLLMLWLLLTVSGVPPAEQQALRSRPEAYREYRRAVSVFVPWFPKARS